MDRTGGFFGQGECILFDLFDEGFPAELLLFELFYIRDLVTTDCDALEIGLYLGHGEWEPLKLCHIEYEFSKELMSDEECFSFVFNH